MGLPLILYDLAPLVNPSFEADADATSPPTGWQAPVGSEIIETDTAEQFDKGSGHGKLAACRLNSVPGEIKPAAVQVVLWMPPVGQTIGLAYVNKGETGAELSRRIIQELDAGLSQNDSTQINGSSVPDDWAAKFLTHTVTDPTSVNTRINVNVETADPDDDQIWVDQFIMGRVLDFAEMPFNAITVSNFFRSNLAVGAGAYESVELADPLAHITATIARVGRDTQLETDLLAFLGYTRGHRKFAFWLDRDDHTNQGKHFAECILDDVVVLGERVGANGRTFQLKFTAPLEWMPQEID